MVRKTTFVVVFFLIFCQCAGIAVPRVSEKVVKPVKTQGNQTGKSYESLVIPMLRAAQDAYAAGRFEEAKNIFFRAKLISPRISEPSWLRPQVEKIQDRKDLNREELLKAARMSPDLGSLGALEEFLLKNGSDTEVRRLAFEIAMNLGKVGSVQTHNAVLNSSRTEEKGVEYWKILVIGIVLIVSLWQIRELYLDWKSTRK